MDQPEEETLRRIEARLDRATDAAERLLAEAAGAAARVASGVAEAAGSAAGAETPSEPPPAGWQSPDAASAPGGGTDPLVALVHSLRDLIPPELQRRLAEALRELLLAVRALIDWYLERTEQRRRAPAEVEDIPIV